MNFKASNLFHFIDFEISHTLFKSRFDSLQKSMSYNPNQNNQRTNVPNLEIKTSWGNEVPSQGSSGWGSNQPVNHPHTYQVYIKMNLVRRTIQISFR